LELYNTFTIPQDAAQKCVLFAWVMHAFDEYCNPKKKWTTSIDENVKQGNLLIISWLTSKR
jgi:hypothetical protein